MLIVVPGRHQRFLSISAIYVSVHNAVISIAACVGCHMQLCNTGGISPCSARLWIPFWLHFPGSNRLHWEYRGNVECREYSKRGFKHLSSTYHWV
ncbi:hypothetical protein IAQ61_002180, partial [Plenodomus lingam]